jgi:hypothetical protein
MRSKGALPVPYIVAIIIAVIVIVVLLVWFFALSGKGSTTATDSFCRAAEFTYCSQWSASGLSGPMPGADQTNPTGKTFLQYAPECKGSAWASQVGQNECKSILGQSVTIPSAPSATSSAAGT